MIHGWPQPLAGDIVWCHFPENLGVKPAHKPRPALILEVFGEHVTPYTVIVAYGTSQKVTRLYAGEFAISEADHAAFRTAGLSYPTKFNLKRRVQLPYVSTYFDIPPGAPFGQTPKLGTLHASLVRRAHAAWLAAK